MESHYALIGDVHSQAHCLESALNHCREHQLTPILLGDLFDSRCPNSESVEVYHLVRSAQKELNAVILHSNHQDKLIRYLKGNTVVLNNGLDTTISEFENSNVSIQELYEFLCSLPYGFVFRSGEFEYRAAHAFFSRKIDIPEYKDYHYVYAQDIPSKIRNVMIYGPTGPNGRIYWWENDHPRDFIRVAGHYHVIHIDDRSLVIDGECGDDKETAFLPLYDLSNSLLKKFK
jgi:hypothetical protein